MVPEGAHLKNKQTNKMFPHSPKIQPRHRYAQFACSDIHSTHIRLYSLQHKVGVHVKLIYPGTL